MPIRRHAGEEREKDMQSRLYLQSQVAGLNSRIELLVKFQSQDPSAYMKNAANKESMPPQHTAIL
jgi:hypothetical protein